MKIVKCYAYKFLFFWIGWMVVHQKESPTFYYDDNPIAVMKPESELKYMTLGLSYNRVIKKLKKYVKRNKEVFDS